MKNETSSHVVRLGARTVKNESAPLNLRERTEVIPVMSLKKQHEVRRIHELVPAAHGILGKVTVLLLIPMLFVYPLLPAYAADESITRSASSTDATTSDATVSAVTPPSDTPAPPTDTSAQDETSSSDATLSGVVLGEATTTDASSSEETSSEATDASSTIDDLGVASTTENETGSSTEEELITGTSTEAVATSTDEIASTTPVVEEEATSTEDVSDIAPAPTAEELAAQMVAQKEEMMRVNIRKEVETEFSKGCLTIDNIGYYCLKDPGTNAGALAPSVGVTSVTSRADTSGTYKQIFMTKGGEDIQLTHDAWDNTFPSMDVSGKSIVWQGEVSGRWQIFFADTATSGLPALFALTHSSESNFNPRVDGDAVVWQGWVDGNWEIFLAERILPAVGLSGDAVPPLNKSLGIDGSWKVTRLTSNSVHDMFPAIAGGLITWQSFQDNAWSVYAYSLKTGATTKLSSGGAKSENPHFAITWDERTPEGAARMVGYDIASGKTIDLTNEARQVNDNSAPYHPADAPISQQNQAALPVNTSGTSTNMKSDSGDGVTGNGLDI